MENNEFQMIGYILNRMYAQLRNEVLKRYHLLYIHICNHMVFRLNEVLGDRSIEHRRHNNMHNVHPFARLLK